MEISEFYSAFIAVPIGLQPVIFDAVLRRDSSGLLTAESVAKGRTHLNRMTKRWTDADRQKFGRNAAPRWNVKTPGIFRSSIVLYVGLPSGAAPSAFHPNAYLPSYVNAPRDADADYYYPYKPEPGLPRMSVVGNVPLYLDEKRELLYQRV
ncbi:hypothetical protein L218DRAFT_918174 [Marasmius fiardii PR-910]|nr:hypothetical protein L218DRAFT_918174 [Marasmius fiardii PR-910]